MKAYKIVLYVSLALIFVFAIIGAARATSSFTFQQNKDVDLRIDCFDVNNSYCNSATSCQISVNYPNSTLFISNQSMGYDTIQYNYSIAGIYNKIIGEYTATITCEGSNNGFTKFKYEITPTGKQLSTSQGLLYFIVLIISMFMFGLVLFGAIAIPYGNEKDYAGGLIRINHKKYIKVGLWFGSYLFLIWLFWLGWGITNNFLYLDFAAKFFYFSYIILISGLFPVFLLFTLITIISAITDKNLSAMLGRGLYPR